MLAPLLIIPIATIILVNVYTMTSKSRSFAHDVKIFGSSADVIIRMVTLLSFNVNLAYSVFLWIKYPKYDGYNLLYPSNSWLELHHILNLPFIILSIFIMVVATLSMWGTIANVHLLSTLLLTLEACLIGAFSCSNVFIFLLFFEAAAIPIFLLILYCGSARRERLKASYYFLFFTLYGSISLMLSLINVYGFHALAGVVTTDQSGSLAVLWVLLFVAFAVKIPLFPVHIWLPYAHVEASTAASILLAALMLKLGGYGVIKFMMPMFSYSTHVFFRPAALLICLAGLIYGGMAAIRQIDLKRQIAFSSISHMSFSTIGVFTFTEIGYKGMIYLMLSHGLTSSALFFLVGVLSERHHTRSIFAYSGLFGVAPLFSFFLLVASLANVGFPGTSGFLPEFLVLGSALKSAPAVVGIMIAGMLATTASSLIALLRLLYGSPKLMSSRSNFSDLNKLEFVVLFALSSIIILLGMYDPFTDPWVLIDDEI